MRKDRVMDIHNRETTVNLESHELYTGSHRPASLVAPPIDDWSTFTDGDTTPDISGSSYWKTANTSATIITNFDNPKDNIHKITILWTEDNTTIAHNANIVIQTDEDFTGEVDDVKVFLWDGTNWVEQAVAAPASLVGTDYFLHDSDASDISGYQRLRKTPADQSETTHVTNVSASDGDVAIEEFVTDEGDPDVLAILAGIWEFHVHASVSSTAGTTNLKIELYRRTTGGVETLIFSTEQEINSTSPVELKWSHTQATDTTMNLTDRLVAKLLCNATSVPSRTVTTFYEGSERAAHIHAPVDLGVTAVAEAHKRHLIFNVWNPNAVQGDDNEICLWPEVDSTLTISKITVTLDASGNEIAGDLKYADTFIGLANPVVINTFDTTSGVLEDGSITSGAVAAGKAIYLAFDSSPASAITQACFDIEYSYD